MAKLRHFILVLHIVQKLFMDKIDFKNLIYGALIAVFVIVIYMKIFQWLLITDCEQHTYLCL